MTLYRSSKFKTLKLIPHENIDTEELGFKEAGVGQPLCWFSKSNDIQGFNSGTYLLKCALSGNPKLFSIYNSKDFNLYKKELKTLVDKNNYILYSSILKDDECAMEEYPHSNIIRKIGYDGIQRGENGRWIALFDLSFVKIEAILKTQN